MFDLELRTDRELRDLPVGENSALFAGRSTENGPILEEETTRSVIGFLTLFEERGRHSGHCYQCPINHRPMSCTDLTSKRIVGKHESESLMKSIVSDKDYLRFDKNNSIAMWFHGTMEVAEEESSSFRSHMRLHYNETGSGVGDTHYSFIRHRRAVHLDGKTFKRVLRVFGYQWTDAGGIVKEDSCVPRTADLVQFCLLFKDCDFRSGEGVKAFLSQFDLGDLYGYNTTVDPRIHWRNLGSLFRSLAPFRTGVYDGQHRFVALALPMTGFFNVTNEIPLDADVAFADAPFVTKGEEDKQLERLQCFRPLKMKVGTLPPGLDMKEVFRTFGKIGLSETRAQSLNFALSWKFLIAKTVERYLERADGEGAEIAEITTFSQFWSVDAVMSETVIRNQGNMARAVASVLEEDEAYMDFCVEGGEKIASKWEAIKKEMTVRMEKALYLPQKTNRTYGVIPRQMQFYLQSLKACCNSAADCRKLPLLFEQQHPSTSQVADVNVEEARFHTMDWFRSFVMEPVYVVFDLFCQKLLVERKIVALLRGQALLDAKPLPDGTRLVDLAVEVLREGPSLESGLHYKPVEGRNCCARAGTKDRSWGYDFGCLHDKRLVGLKREEEITMRTVGVLPSQAAEKVKVAAYSTILKWTVDAILKHGYNPDINISRLVPTAGATIRRYTRAYRNRQLQRYLE